MERRRTTAPKPSVPPIGFRFHPNDAELADHFLRRKIHDLDCANMPIAEVKVCDFEPWDLPEKSKVKSTDKTWYFFCPRDFKYAKSRRSNRRTKMGFWKPTGKTRKVKGIRKKESVATKKTIVFYENSHSGKVKTDWVIHEYEYLPVQGSFVLCKLKCKSAQKIESFETMEITPAPASPTTSEIEVTSSCGECDPNDNSNADIEDQNVGEMADISTYENDEHSCASVCDFENLYSNEVSSCPVNDESNPGDLVISGFDYSYEAVAPLTFKGKFSGEEADIFIGGNSDKIIKMWDSFAGNEIPHVETDLPCSSVATELDVIAAPLIDVQGPSTFFDDMKMWIEPIVY